ncbi:hypothetical protein [Caballeronia ptereochthonis]|uniref:hypothetical protein n=1 Tax=Caballeronia ptereochthonis TaxID=1777144 RepID=UPI00117ED7B3|nr:hypothetical protein [Caballeronia ptereochthonis]
MRSVRLDRHYSRNRLSFRGLLEYRPLDFYSIVAHENGSSHQRDSALLSDVPPIDKVAEIARVPGGTSVLAQSRQVAPNYQQAERPEALRRPVGPGRAETVQSSVRPSTKIAPLADSIPSLLAAKVSDTLEIRHLQTMCERL